MRFFPKWFHVLDDTEKLSPKHGFIKGHKCLHLVFGYVGKVEELIPATPWTVSKVACPHYFIRFYIYWDKWPEILVGCARGKQPYQDK